MCGIIGTVGQPDETVEVLTTGLGNLEYRGYDSAGIAVVSDGIEVEKHEGELENLTSALDRRDTSIQGDLGIGHTRWSTHGPPSDRNSHPHTDEEDRVAVVHNGIIENYQTIKSELQNQGVTFSSDTDTEVVPHLLGQYLEDGHTPESAFRQAIDRLDGSFALAAIVEDRDAIFAARNDSPLVLGIGDQATYLASDVPAFLEFTRDVVYLDDGDVAILTDDDWTVTDAAGAPVDKPVETVEWDAEQTGKSGYDHYMKKEIHEQPTALRQALSGRVDELSTDVALDEVGDLGDPDHVQFVACGTSYHASLYGAELMRDAGIPATASIASEYAIDPAPITEDTLVVGITQSGETADTLSALREARDRGADTLALTNVVGSTAARECANTLYIRAGPEIGVAATKTFSSQLLTLTLLVERFRDDVYGPDRDLVSALRDLPSNIQQILDESDASGIVDEYADKDGYFFIGRGLSYPVALEGALKFKEITYEHAEGFAAGELKHGPLALVTENTPVFAVVTGTGERATKTIGNVKEVEARGAPVVAVTDGQADVERYADHVLEIPDTHEQMAPILANVQLQLVAYHVADRMNRSIDKPRNLAKSVTVE
jgi:glucosamine--fructose-6-phosphate aminotransferase (isomerizing)